MARVSPYQAGDTLNYWPAPTRGQARWQQGEHYFLLSCVRSHKQQQVDKHLLMRTFPIILFKMITITFLFPSLFRFSPEYILSNKMLYLMNFVKCMYMLLENNLQENHFVCFSVVASISWTLRLGFFSY
jgi:hypothetical protein